MTLRIKRELRNVIPDILMIAMRLKCTIGMGWGTHLGYQ